MKLEFTIPGYARAQGRTKAVAMLPKGGKGLQSQAKEILDFYGSQAIPQEQQEVIRNAIGLSARAHVYEQTVDRDWKNTIRWHLIQHRQDPLWDGPIIVVARFITTLPKSYPKWMHDRVAAGYEDIPKITKPDTEQLIKPILDACRGLIWRDDCLVWRGTTEKVYGKVPRVEVTLELVEDLAARKGGRHGSVRKEVRGVREEAGDVPLPLAGVL